MYQPPGGEVQIYCPWARASHEPRTSGFQAFNCARVTLRAAATTKLLEVLLWICVRAQAGGAQSEPEIWQSRPPASF